MTDFAAEAKTSFEKIKAVLAEDGWTEFEHKTADVKAWKKALPGKSVEIVKATGEINGVEPKVLMEKVYNQSFEEKKKGDDTFLNEETLEAVSDDSKVLYQLYAVPWPLSNRDLVILRSKWEEDGTFYQVDISTKHEKKPDPTGSNVRADLLGCYKYEPIENGTRATYCVFMDPMGNVPAFVVNAGSAKVPKRVGDFRSL